jgi:membrane protein
MANLENKIKNLRWVRIIRLWAKQIVLPGFEGVSLYSALRLFFKGLFLGALPQRAAAIAYSFFLAIFPSILFFFTLIPYLPVDNLNEKVIKLLSDTLPPAIYDLIIGLVNDIVSRSHFGLLSFGFILAFLFATNGFKAIIGAFNTSVNVKERRNFWQIQWISLVLLVIVSIITVVAIALMTFYQVFLNYFIELGYIKTNWVYYLIVAGNWIIQLSLIYFIFSFIYYFAPHTKGTRYKIFSAGATFATLLFIISFLLFDYYAANFARYNALYGSIGTIILLMLWIYFVAFVLLIGFELNASIKSGKIEIEK